MKPRQYCKKHAKSFFPAMDSIGCKECDKLYMEFQSQEKED